ncbi:MAG: hypothetical protein QOE70_6028 [Chthoniobacter sp.]|jgi:PAS domain S-box-containing protein|nr:hypothetical protein [Chthoniobacter sp.]
MIDDQLQELAALYASGAMSAEERGHLELLLPFHRELELTVDHLLETAALAALATPSGAGSGPSSGLKARILASIAGREQRSEHEALVMAGPDALVQWVNPEFTKMCGYTLEELRGRSLGPILQGELTDKAAAKRVREAVHGARPCRERLINYRKDGESYWVEIQITPIFKEDGELRCFVARERELAGEV